MSGAREPHESRDEREVQLLGGTANQGQVVRVGDTVRRPQPGWRTAPACPETYAAGWPASIRAAR